MTSAQVVSTDNRCVHQAECALGQAAASVEGFPLPERPGPSGIGKERLRYVCSVSRHLVGGGARARGFSLLDFMMYISRYESYLQSGACRLLGCELRFI